MKSINFILFIFVFTAIYSCVGKPSENVNYNNTSKKKDTTIYSKIPESNDDLWVMSQHGDRFDALAFQYYKDPL